MKYANLVYEIDYESPIVEIVGTVVERWHCASESDYGCPRGNEQCKD